MEFVTNLHNLLHGIATSQSSDLIQHNSEHLKNVVYTKAECLPALIEIAASESSSVLTAVRQLAAIEASKRVKSYWKQLPEDVLQQLQNKVISRTFTETDKKVRGCLGRIVSSLARATLSKGKWPSLLPGLAQQCAAPSAEHRETSLRLLAALFERVPAKQFLSCPDVIESTTRLLSDPESFEVRAAAIKAVNRMLEQFSFNKNIFRACEDQLPAITEILRVSIQRNAETTTEECFAFFEELLSAEIKPRAATFCAVIEMLVQILLNKDLSEEIRRYSGNKILMSASYNPKQLIKHKLVQPVLTAICDLTLEIPVHYHEKLASTGCTDISLDFDDCDAAPLANVALEIIHTFSYEIASKHVFPPIAAKIAEFCKSSNPYARRSAATIARLTCDGCSDPIADNLSDFFGLASSLMADPDIGVQKDACSLIVALAQYFESELADTHQDIMNRLHSCLQSSEPILVLHAFKTLDVVIDVLGSAIQGYLPNLIEIFSRHLSSSEISIELRQSIIEALGSAASSSGELFTPYFAHFYPIVLPLTENLDKKNKMIDLRIASIDTMSAMISGVEKEVFRPKLDEIVNLSMRGLDSDLPDIRQRYYSVLSEVIKKFGDEAAPLLPVLLPKLFSVLPSAEEGFDNEDSSENDNNEMQGGDQSEDIEESDIEDYEAAFSDDDSDDNAGDRFLTPGGMAEDFDDDDDDDDGSRLAQYKGYYASNEAIGVAIETIGKIFESTRGNFFPYLEQSISSIKGSLNNYSEDIRNPAFKTLCIINATMYQIMCPKSTEDASAAQDGRSWTPGIPLVRPVPNEVVQIVCGTVPHILDSLEKELDPDVAADMCDTLQSSLLLAGPCMLAGEGMYARACEIALSILNRKHRALLEIGYEEDEKPAAKPDDENGDDEELSRSASILVGTGGDLTVALATILGPQFANQGRKLVLALCKYFRKTSSNTERQMAIGCIGELCAAIGEGVSVWFDKFLKIAFAGLKDHSEYVMGNAAFTLSQLVLYSTTPFDRVAFLQALQPLFAAKGKHTIENACGTLARIELRCQRENPQSLAFLETFGVILPLVPAKDDTDENEPIAQLLLSVLSAGSNPATTATAAPMIHDKVKRIVEVLATMLLEPNIVTPNVHAGIVQGLRAQMSSALGPQLKDAVLALPEAQRNAMVTILQ